MSIRINTQVIQYLQPKDVRNYTEKRTEQKISFIAQEAIDSTKKFLMGAFSQAGLMWTFVCPMGEFVYKLIDDRVRSNQLLFPSTHPFHYLVYEKAYANLKIRQIEEAKNALKEWPLHVFVEPFVEEVIFRYALQDKLLKCVPQFVLRKIGLKKCANYFDGKIVAAARIALSAVLFGLVHCVNRNIYSDSTVKQQVISATVHGIFWGMLYEAKKGGLATCTGAHMIQNIRGTCERAWFLRAI